MGWASGSRLFRTVIEAVKPAIVDSGTREALYMKLIEAFEADDWDTQDECLGEDPAYDKALKALHPGWYD